MGAYDGELAALGIGRRRRAVQQPREPERTYLVMRRVKLPGSRFELTVCNTKVKGIKAPCFVTYDEARALQMKLQQQFPHEFYVLFKGEVANVP